MVVDLLQLHALLEYDLEVCLSDFPGQCYWLFVFCLALLVRDVDALMKIVYDERHILPRHAHMLAGRAILHIIRHYIAKRYHSYCILRDTSAHFRHSLYDIWLLLPELRPAVDVVRKEFVCARVST